MTLESDSGLGVSALAENFIRLDVAANNSTAILMDPYSQASENETIMALHKRKIFENLRKITCQAKNTLNLFTISNICLAYWRIS
jgi:hypothetical protein